MAYKEIFIKGNQPTIDVILPFHQVNKHLYSALKSILRSRSVSVHLILVDNCIEPTQDFQQSVVEVFKDRDITYLCGSERGYANALNFAQSAIKSDYVAIMNSDDLSGSMRLARSIHKIEKTNSDICLGRILKFKRFTFLPSLAGSINLNRYSTSLLVLGAFGADATVVVKKEFWLKHMNYPKDLQPSDWILALRVYGNARITTEPKARYYYRIHAKQTTSSESTYSLSGLFGEIRNFADSANLPSPPRSLQSQISCSWINFDPLQFPIAEYLEWEEAFLGSLPTKECQEAKRILQRKRCLFRLRGVPLSVNPFIFAEIILEGLILMLARAGRD